MRTHVNIGREELTYAMGTGMLPVALGPQLVALVTGAADPSSDGTSHSRYACGRSVWMLAVLHLLVSWPSQVRVVNTDMLLELLQSVVGALGKSVEAGCVDVARGNVPVGEQRCRGDGVVWREAVERVGQHCEMWSWCKSVVKVRL